MAQIQGSREQILISAYNDGYEFFNQYKQNTQAFYDKAVQDAKNEQLGMQILGFSPIGWIYNLGKGLYNGIVGLGEGVGVMLSNAINNFAQTYFVHENPIGSAEWFKEFASDYAYMAFSGLFDSAQGIANGAINFLGNMGAMVGITPEWTEQAKGFINKATYNTKAQILNFQFGKVDPTVPNFRTPEEHTFDITKDAIKGIDAFANNIYWKEDMFAPYMQDNQATKKAYEIVGGTLESIGRMIPSIAITALTGGSAIGTLASSGYFYATTYGQSFNEAIEKGLTIEDANLYASQIAGIETLTEQIGGFTFSGGIGKDVLANIINEGIEEVIAEMATSGITYDESGKPIYEKPSELLERVLTAGFTGALSGGIMSGGQVWYTASQKGTAYNYLDDIQKTIMKSVSKEGLDNVQKSITKSLDDGLEGLNKVVKNKKNLEKTKKYLSESQASLFIEFDNKTNQFVLTDFGKEIHSDIRARQGQTILNDDYVASVSPATKIQENITVEEINKNGKQITVNEKINLLQKNNYKYEKNKEIINKIFDISKKMGISVAFYDGDLRNSQGFYYNGVSYININSDGVNGNNLLQQIYAHEIFHQIFDKYKNGLLSKKAQKNVLKLMDTVLEAMKNDDKFLNEVANKTAYIKDEKVLMEEHLAYFIEKYVNMDNVIERFAWRSPNIFRKMIDQITGIRTDGKMSIIEEQYLELLKEIDLQSVDSISSILQLSRLTQENVKHSKLVQRKMYNKKTNSYSPLLKYLILVDKKGNYILPKEIEKSFIIKSDSDVVNHKDYKAFALALRNKDVKALVDNFLATDQKNETLYKRLIGIKSAHLFEYMEANKFYRHNEVMEMIKNDLVAEIDKRLAEQKELLKGKEVVEGNLIKVNAKSFWNVFALNYMKMWRENYVSLYPLSVYENTEHLYLRDDLLAGFAVQGEKNQKNEAFNRYELASLFRSGGDAGWLKSKVDFIVQKLGARYLASVSNKVAKIYNSVFNNAISIVRKTFINDEADFIQEIENGGYGSMYMALDWSASYSNYIVSELALREDEPTYMGIHQIGYSKEGTEKPSVYFSKQNPKDSVGNSLTQEQQEYFKDSKVRDENGNLLVVYHGTTEKFNTFDINKSGKATRAVDKALFFTDSQKTADEFSYETKPSSKSDYLVVRTGKKGNVGSYYLDMKKPLNLSKLIKSEIEMIAEHDSQGGDLNFVNTIIEAINRYLDSGNHQGIKTFLDYDYLQSKGYDGIIARMYSKYQKAVDNNAIEYAVFNPNQIKSIDNKNPTSNPDIRFSKQSYVTESQYETLKDTLVKDEKGNVIPVYQSIASKDNPVVTSFVGSSIINSGYCFLGNSDYFKNDNTYVIDVFVNITNSFDQKTTINQFTFEKIMAEAVKTVKSLTPETIERYRQKFIENDEQNFLGIFEPISYTLGNKEDLLNLKKSITNVTGLDGYIGRNSTNEIISVTAWYEEQIKGVNSIFTSKNKKDTILFSPEEMIADKLKDQIEFIFKQRILNKDFERITNQELIDNGYIFKITGKPFYLNKRHFRLPVNYEIQDVQYNKEHNELVLKIMNTDNKYTSDLLVTQDYIVMDGDKIEKIYRNARYLSFGTTEIRLEDLAKTGKSISQSIALEDASDTYPESLFYTQEKDGLPSTFILLKSDVLNKKDTIVGSNDYFTKTRKIFDNYTMMFDTDVLEKTPEEKEQMYRVALKEIRKNNGVLTEEIEKRFDIYDNNDPNFDLKISKSTNDHFIKQMQKYIKNSSSFINPDRFWQLRTIQILRDLVFVGQTNKTTVSDSNRDNRFLYSFDEALESLTNFYKKYDNISDIVENIKGATNKNLEEYKMKEYLSALPYNYNNYDAGSYFNSKHEVREIKANIVLSDVEAVFYKDGDINHFQDYYDDIEVENFTEKILKHKQALDKLREKGVKVLRVANKESFNQAILNTTDFEVINHNNTLFSKADNGQMLAENSTVDVDSMISRVMFSKAYVPVVSSDKTSALNNLNSVKVYEHNKKNYKELERVYATFLATYKPAKTTTTDKIIAKLVENIESRIRTNNNKIQLYNHMYINVAKYLVIQINAMNVPNAQKTTDMEREILISGTNEIIARTMTYLDSTFNNNDINISKYNPNGYQYIRKINWAMREVLDNNNHKHDGVAFIQDLYDAIFQLDITDKTSMEGFYDALTKFEERTNIAQVNSCALDSEGEFAHTIPNVKEQANLWIESSIEIVGRLLPYYDKNGKRKIKRSGGLLGDNMLIDNLNIAKWIADPFTFAEVASLFMKNALPQVIQNRLFSGSKKQLEVLNLVSEYFEKGGWLKKNTKKIEALEKNYVGIKNLLDANGNPTNMSQSQVITLYRTLLREIILNRAIDEGHIIGIKTNHFANGNKVKITENVKNKIERESKGREAKIVDNIALLNELDALMESDAFMKEYSQKTMAFFEMLYPYVNASFKDINGLELNNDAETIKEALNDMDESEKEQLLEDLPEGLDLSQIYIPFRNAGQSYMGSGAFDVNNILDLGIFDGITQSLTDSSSMLLIDSINNLIPAYAKEVANYYGLYRIATDLNVLFGTQQAVDGTTQVENLAQKMTEYNPEIVRFYEELLKDIAGYSTLKDGVSQSFDKLLATLRKNFFRASLALNVKVIATQFASMITCGTIFGDGSNLFSNTGFMAKFTKNLFMAGSKTKAKYLVENSEIYKNRSKMSTYEISEATEKGFTKNPVSNAVEFLMRGITLTDNMINRALFITLTETIDPETNAMYTEEKAMEKVEEAIERYQSSGDAISRSELLRTENQVLRLFTKFLGEPMKMMTNFYGVSKNLRVIHHFEKNKVKILAFFEAKKLAVENNLDREKIKYQDRLDYQNTPEFAKLSDKEKRQYALENEKERKKLAQLEFSSAQQKRIYDSINKNVEEVIADKPKVKEKLARLVTAFAGSLMWQVALGMIFKLIRGGAKEKPEEEEMWKYLSKMFGKQLGIEFVGYFPFLRDVYSVVINGFSANDIDELQAFNDFGLQLSYLITDIANGGDFNYGRHIRQFALSMGSALGIPARNIERLFTTPMSWFSNTGTFVYKSATGQRVDVNQELTNAVENQDEKMIEAIISQKLNDRNIMLGQDVVDELERLAGVNGKMITISGDYGSFKIDGKEYVLTREQQEKFTEIYSRADYIASKIIKSEGYKKLNDIYKAKFLTAIFNYFYKMAKQEISGKKLIAEKNYFSTLEEAYAYFSSAVAERLYNTMINEQEKGEA